MSVNITNLTGVDSLYDMAVVAQGATNNIFFGLILVAFFIILVINLKQQGADRAIAGASFSCLILSLLLFNLGLLQILFPVAFALILGGTLFYLKFKAE